MSNSHSSSHAFIDDALLSHMVFYQQDITYSTALTSTGTHQS